jgi:glycine oxidase
MQRTPSSHHDVAVIGAGIIGLAVAWAARARGLSVELLDRGEPDAATSHVAAGMLAPATEADPGERELLVLGLRSARAWPAFAARLRAASGIDVGLRECGALVVARDRDEAEALERERSAHELLGVETTRLTPSEARSLEPALAPALRAALHAAGDHAVDPRLACAALEHACTRAGVTLRRGVEVGHASELAADQIVVAAGAWSGAFGDEPRVRPVKGQSLRLRDPGGPGLLTRIVRFAGGYLVPRGDGRYVLGATVEERGFDTTMTAGAIHELLRDASELVPGVLELEVEETIAGLRPGTPDNAPVIGRSLRDPRVVWATGHYRNGVLLAPVTAELVASELAREPVAHPFGPGRFAIGAAA